MVKTYRKVESPDKVCVTLNDLVKINYERIECYNQAKKYSMILPVDCNYLFDNIVAESHRFIEELNLKINELDRHPKIMGYASGYIHSAWSDLKVAITGNTQNALLNNCKYNEEVTQMAYKAALGVSAETNGNCFVLIEGQWMALKCVFNLLTECHEVRPYSRSFQTYFN